MDELTEGVQIYASSKYNCSSPVNQIEAQFFFTGLCLHQTVSFPNQHFSGSREVASVDCVQINTTANRFAHLVASIPIDGL